MKLNLRRLIANEVCIDKTISPIIDYIIIYIVYSILL